MTTHSPRLPDETGRLETVRSFDTDQARGRLTLDRVARIAKWLFDTPIALVTLVEEDWQEFLTHYGTDLEGTPREHSFCAHALASSSTLVVPDALEDDRFRTNPLVLDDPNIRYYAGAPMVTSRGHGIGSVCVIDSEPRAETDPMRMAILVTLAEIATDALEQTFHARRLSNSLERIESMLGTLEKSAKS